MLKWREVLSIYKEILLYERVQAEYDQFIDELKEFNQNELSQRIHELRLKTLAFNLIAGECYTKGELEYLILQDNPLSILYEMLIRYI